MITDFGLCFLCGQVCRLDDPDITQLDAGKNGWAHISCVQEAAEDLVDTEAEIGRQRAS